jgi:hypothetical protein
MADKMLATLAKLASNIDAQATELGNYDMFLARGMKVNKK